MSDKLQLWWQKHGAAVAVGIVMLFFAGVLAYVFIDDYEGSDKSLIPWQPYSETALTDAKAAGKPVLVDFSADWCEPCHRLDRLVFSKQKVADAAADFVALRVDMTDEKSPPAVELATKYAVFGYPTIVFIGRDGQERLRLRLFGVELADDFIKRLNAVK